MLNRTRFIAALTALLIGSAHGQQAVPLYGMFETSVTNTNHYDNKFQDVLLEAEFTSPSGKKTPFWGFFDGTGDGGGERYDVVEPVDDFGGELSGTVWKLRFMPTETGTWEYTWKFSDNSENGSGSFNCTSSNKRGVLNVLESNPHWLEDANGEPFFPKVIYIRPGEQCAYPIDRYNVVYDNHISAGFNLIVFPWLPIWTWNTQQLNPANEPSDRGILLWRQVKPYPDEYHSKLGETGTYFEGPSADYWDADRMNLFTWKRLDEHLAYLAEKGVYTWGFQGFNIKRTFSIQPHNFGGDKYQWYIRYCMARLAPYYNLIWNNTWESSNGSDEFKRLTQQEKLDPWRRVYFQVDSDDNRYDVMAADRKCCGDFENATRPIWSTESNGLWGSADYELVWRFLTKGVTPYHTKVVEATHRRSLPFHEWIGDDQKRIAYAFNLIGDETDFGALTPRSNLSSTGFCLAHEGVEYVVYSSSASSFTVDVGSGEYEVTWLNIKTDDHEGHNQITGGEEITFHPPDNDYRVLHLRNTTAATAVGRTPDMHMRGPEIRPDNSGEFISGHGLDPKPIRVRRGGALLEVTGLSPDRAYTVTLIDTRGRVSTVRRTSGAGGNLSFSTAHLSRGIYLVRIPEPRRKSGVITILN